MANSAKATILRSRGAAELTGLMPAKDKRLAFVLGLFIQSGTSSTIFVKQTNSQKP